MAPSPSNLMCSGFKKKEPRYLCLSEARASHSHKMCTEVSSSVSHFLQVGSLLSPITCRCLLRVLCPISRPITALDCVLLKNNSRAPMARLGSEINSRSCPCVLQGPRHSARCCALKWLESSDYPNTLIPQWHLLWKHENYFSAVCLVILDVGLNLLAANFLF
jgi:hypothetical protein